MPRNYSDLSDSSETTGDVPDHSIPDLTYENARELVAECDYIVVSMNGAEPKQIDHDIHWASVSSKRLVSLWREFYNRFEPALFPEDGMYARTENQGTTRHAKLAASGPGLFDELEQFIEETVPLWSFVAISYCWADHAHPRASTLLYQLTDRMPPHPDVTLDKPPDQLAEEEIEEYLELQETHLTYDESDAPRFEYGPTLILNGDYDAAGADITAYGWEHLEIDIRLDSHYDERPSFIFPSMFSKPWYEDMVDFVENYPEHLSVTEVTDHQTEVSTNDLPMPLLADAY